MKSTVLEKVLERIDQIDPEEIQALLARLMREKGFLQRVFESLQEGVVILDADFSITFINPAACRFFGANADQVIGERVSRMAPGLDLTHLEKSPRASVRRDLEVFYPERRLLNFYLTPVAEADELDLGYVLLLHDVTSSRAETEAQIESERFNALTMLAAGVAHEIGNPLNSLSLHLQLLQRKLRKIEQPDQAMDSFAAHLETAQEEVGRLDTILQQFLQAIRPTTPHRERTDLHEILEKTLLSLRPELESRSIKVTLETAEKLPSLDLDHTQIGQALYNVLRNAYQALSPGGHILIQSRATDFEVVLRVADDGSGISSEAMGTLFEPFQTTKKQGTGLGLLIVRRILREHGGELALESELGQGTTVTLRFPRADQQVRLLPNGSSTIEI